MYFFTMCFLTASWGTSFSTRFMAVILIIEQCNSGNQKKVYSWSMIFNTNSAFSAFKFNSVCHYIKQQWTKCEFCAQVKIWWVKTKTTSKPAALSIPCWACGSYSCSHTTSWIKTFTPLPCASYFLWDWEVKRINTFQSKRCCFAGWTLENNIVGELCGGCWLLEVMVVGGRGTNRAHQTNKATIHVPSSVMENVFPPDTENRLRGKSAKTTDGERGPCLCGSGSVLWEPHSHLHRGKRKQAYAPQSREEMKGLILFLRGPGDQMVLKARGTCAGSWCFSPWLS